MIAAVKREDKITVGISICDTSIDMAEKDLVIEENIPFWKVKGEKECYVFASCATYSTELLRFSDYVFRGITDCRSVLEKVVPKMRNLLGRFERLKNDKSWNNEMIIIKGNKLFSIDSYFCVSEIDAIESFGFSEEYYIKGGLEATKDLDSTESILMATRNTERMLNNKLFPMIIFDSKTKRKKIYYK